MPAPSLPSLLQALNGITGGINGSTGIQVLGTGDFDTAKPDVTTIYTPPANNTSLILFTGALIVFPDGGAPDPTSGLPLDYALYYNGHYGMVLPCTQYGTVVPTPNFSYVSAYGFMPLGTDTVVTGAFLATSDVSKKGQIMILGCAVPSS